MDIFSTAVIAALIISVQHLVDWQSLIGRRQPPRLAAYSMGTAAILIPLFTLYVLWGEIRAAIALACVTFAAGGSVLAWYFFDDWNVPIP